MIADDGRRSVSVGAEAERLLAATFICLVALCTPTELHNDGGARLHLSRLPVPELKRHMERSPDAR